MNPITVAFLDHSTDFSGGQKSLLALLTSIDRRRFEPLAIIDYKANRMISELRALGIRVEQINYLNSTTQVVALPILLWKIRNVLALHKVGVVHCNTFKVGLICSLLSLFAQHPMIFRSRLGIKVNNHGIVDQIIFRRADLILANSHYVKQTFSERFGESEKVQVIYNPLFNNYSLDQAAIQELRGKLFSEPAFYFGCIGRIEPFKRQHEIVEAVRYLIQKRKDLKVIFLGGIASSGGDQYKEQLTAMIEKYNLGKYFLFAGFIEKINEATSLLDAVVLCTEGEPLSRGIFESQLLGIPVIGSDSGGNKELIDNKETGLLYKLNDPEDLARQMDLLMTDNELRAKISKSADAFVRQAFTPDRTILAEQDLYIETFQKYFEKRKNS